MKKTFLKRAAATAATASLTLTQCLIAPTTNAVDDSTTNVKAASLTSATLDDLLRIEPVTVESPDNVQVSDWNEKYGTTVLLLSEGTDTTVDTDVFKSMIASNAGVYSELISKILDEVGDISVTVQDGVITATGEIDELSGIIAEEAQGRIDIALDDVKDDYPQVDFSSLETVDFSNLVGMSGEFTATIDISNIENSTQMPITYTIVTSDGESLTITGDNNIFDFVYDKYEAARDSVLAAAAELFAEVQAEFDDASAQLDEANANVAATQAKFDEAVANGADTTETQAELDAKKAELADAQAEYDAAYEAYQTAGADAQAEIAEVFDSYDKQIAKVKSFMDTYLTADFSTEKSYTNSAEALAVAKTWAENRNLPGAAKIPSSFTAALSNTTGEAAYEEILNQFAAIAGVSLNISAAEAGAALDSLYDITLTVEDGIWTINAYLTDVEQQEVIDYYATYMDENVTNTWKEVAVTFDANAFSTGSGYVQLDLVRILEKEPITTTTTTETTTTETTTTETTTTTTTTTTTSEITTTTTTTTTITTTSETTTTTEEPVDGTTTTTTTEEPIEGTTTTTTEVAIVSSYVELESTHGYYFSHDNCGFNKGQIISVSLTNILSDGTTETIDITDDVDFGDATPENTYKSTNTTFTYQVQLYYGDVALTYKNGDAATVTAYIGVKGDTNLDNTVDSADASYVLSYYASVQVSTTQDMSIKLTQDDDDLDNLAAFLSDIDVYEDDSDNITCDKTSRLLDASDASYILSYYSKQQISTDSSYDIWNSFVSEYLIQR